MKEDRLMGATEYNMGRRRPGKTKKSDSEKRIKRTERWCNELTAKKNETLFTEKKT